MKILVVHGRYRSTAPSGENHVVDQESAALVAAGHEVIHFERHSDDIAGWSLGQKIALPARSVRNRPVAAELRDLLGRAQPDVVHVHNTFPLLSPSVLDACADAGVPVVATIHNYKLLCASGDFFRDGSPCHSCAGGAIGPAVRHGCYRGSTIATAPVVAGLRANRAHWRELVSAYVFISAAQRELMSSLDLPRERVFVKHNFVPEPVVDVATVERAHVVTYVGRLDAAKGVPFLMQAWDRFRASNPRSPLRLQVVGGGPLEGDVTTWAGGRADVEVLGLVPRARATALLAGSLAAVVPSAWEETFGLVAVEAMAVGTPPIVPAHGAFPELVRDGYDGVHHAPGDVEGLAAVLGWVDREPAAFAAVGERARASYLATHRPADNVDRLLGIYRYAVEHPVRGAARVH